MNERLAYHYDKELQHLRETAADFAYHFGGTAERIGIDPHEQGICPDPFVERLLEGVAYLTARVQLKMEAEFPRFSEGILETVAPHFLAPIPAMMVVQIQPEEDDAATAVGVTIPRGAVIRSRNGRGTTTECEFKLAQETRLWPIKLTDASYHTRDLSQFQLAGREEIKAVLSLKFELTAGVSSEVLELDKLPIFISADEGIALRIYEALFSKLKSASISMGKNKEPHPITVRPMGFEPNEALIPARDQTFDGYRLLTEYFHFPKRFMFFELQNLNSALKQLSAGKFEVILAFSHEDAGLDGRVSKSQFQLFATPAINLVERRLDRIQVDHKANEYHLIADHQHQIDYEIHSIVRVEGIGENQDDIQPYRPFYSNFDYDFSAQAYYTVHRVPRTLREREMLQRAPDYRGTECYISIVDGNQSPFPPKVEQLSVSALCTNRHLPLLMQRGVRRPGESSTESDFDFRDIGIPTKGIYMLGAPVPPKPPLMWTVKHDQKEGEGVLVWRILSHLSLNYLSIDSHDGKSSSGTMKEILGIYSSRSDVALKRQVEALESVVVKKEPVFERVEKREGEGPSPIAFAKGVRVVLTFREDDSGSLGVFLLASVMERFLSKYVSINSFTETTLNLTRGGVVHCWKGRPGNRPIL